MFCNFSLLSFFSFFFRKIKYLNGLNFLLQKFHDEFERSFKNVSSPIHSYPKGHCAIIQREALPRFDEPIRGESLKLLSHYRISPLSHSLNTFLKHFYHVFEKEKLSQTKSVKIGSPVRRGAMAARLIKSISFNPTFFVLIQVNAQI